MTKIITLTFIIFLLYFSLAHAIEAEEKLYYVTLHYSMGEITNDKVNVRFGHPPMGGESKGYRLVLLDGKERELYSTFFSVTATVEVFPTEEEPMWGGYLQKKEFDDVVLVPYFTEGKTMKLYNPDGKEIKTIDVSCYMHCNQDGKCNERENSDICPEDCRPGEKGAIRKYLEGVSITEEEMKELGEESRRCIVTQESPLPAVQRVTVVGAPAGITDINKLVKLQQVPLTASNFTKFVLILGVEPLANFSEVTLELGYTCIGPRYNVFKCMDWDFLSGKCRNDSAWTAFMSLSQGLALLNITLRPYDPGLGIGPSPFVPYCGDGFCDQDESSYTCALDCGGQASKGWLEQLISLLTGSATACAEQWECGDWGQYNAAGERMRTCYDKNKCGTTFVKPSVSETCHWEKREEEKKAYPFSPLLIILFISVILFYFWRARRKGSGRR